MWPHTGPLSHSARITDLQDRLEAAERRRQPLAERPTALEITAAQGMIARFDGFEQLAGAYLFGAAPTSANLTSDERRHRPHGSRQPWLPGRFRRTAPWPTIRIRPIWSGWPAYRHSLPAPPAS